MDKSAAALYDDGGGEVHETKTDQRIPDFAAAERLHCGNGTKHRADDGSKSNDTRRNNIHNANADATHARNNGNDFRTNPNTDRAANASRRAAAEMPTDPPATQPTQEPTEAPQPTEAVSWDTEEAVAQVCTDCNAYIVSIGCTADPAAACWAAPQYTHWEGGNAAWLRDQLIAGIDYYKSTGVTALYVTYEADPRGGFQVYLRYAI